MPIVATKRGDVLSATETHVVQQMNCLTVSARGLALATARRFPWADVYRERRRMRSPDGRPMNCAVAADRAIPGTVELRRSRTDDRVLVYLFAQWAPGRSGVGTYPREGPDGVRTFRDTPSARIGWFKECLESLEATGIDRVAMPEGIGCGLAGGDWRAYRAMIDACTFDTVLYKQ